MVAFDGRTTEAPRMSRPARALVGLRGRARVALAVMPSARLRRGGHPGDPPGPVAPAPAPISPAPGPAAPAAPATLGRSTRQAFREALGNPGIRRIQAAWTLGIAGDQALLVALLVVAYTAGGPVAIAILGIARMAPSIVIAPLAGSVAGRMAPARLLLVTQLVRLGGAAGVALLLVAGGPLPAVLAAAVVLATAGALVRPFQAASMPSFARTPGELVAANVVSSVGEGTGGVVGPVAAGLLVVVAGPPAVAVVATGLIGLAVAALAGMPAPESAAWPARSSRGQEPLHPLAILRGAVLGGPAALRGRPGAQMLAISMTSQTFVRGLLTTLLVVASLQLGLGEGGIGLLTGALGLGTLAGALGASGLAGRRNLGPVFAVSLSAWGFPLAIIGAVPLPAVALAALLVTGVANAILDISGFTLLQRNVDARERVAVFGFLEALIGLGVATGGVVAPVLIAAFGAQGSLAIAGAILPIMAVATWPRIHRADLEAVVPEQRLALIRGIPMFRELSITAMERLAASLVPVRFEAGVTVMHEGAPGDSYVIITDGSVGVSRDGRPLNRCGAGEGIGEIALLRAIPRTATVTTLEPVTGLRLDSGDFLAAIAGPTARAAADATVEQRLARPVAPVTTVTVTP